MGWVDVDVIAKPGKKDLSLQAFRAELENEAALARAFGVAKDKRLVKDVTDLADMISRIITEVGPNRIRRLRIYGHGSPNTVQIGPLVVTGRRVEDLVQQPALRIDQADYDKVIFVIPEETRTHPGGPVVKTEYKLPKGITLSRLTPLFDPRGWVELHSCRIAGQYGQELIDALARLWKVEVHASEVSQTVAGGLGFQGRVWKGHPQRKPSLLPPPQAQGTLMPPGATYSDLSTRKTFQVDALGWHVQTGSPSALAARFGVRPPAQAFQTRYDPLREAVNRLQTGARPVLPMRPGTTFSDLSTRKSFAVDAFGMHKPTGALQALATRLEPKPAAQSFQARYDPLGEAARRLQSGSSALASSMHPGTTYSDLSTRNTFVVDPFGRHVQTGSQQFLATRFESGPTAQSFQAWQDPLRQAAHKLGG